LEGHEGWVRSVTFSRDGTLLVSASDDDTIRFWRVADGLQLRILRGHTANLRGVALTADGATLASGAEDGMVRLWGIK